VYHYQVIAERDGVMCTYTEDAERDGVMCTHTEDAERDGVMCTYARKDRRQVLQERKYKGDLLKGACKHILGHCSFVENFVDDLEQLLRMRGNAIFMHCAKHDPPEALRLVPGGSTSNGRNKALCCLTLLPVG
jgi:2-polyprenyl-3-methyl-5-hydroxy-6-metoxy-1,4-benzoquinol methylase